MSDKDGEVASASLVEPSMADAEASKPSDLPPSYHDEKPPPYDAIYGKIKEAKSQSTGNVDYALRVFTLIFCGTFCTALFMIFVFAIPITMVIIGAVYKDDCPIERFIPIYLIVAGSFGIFLGVIATYTNIRRCVRGDEEDETERRKPNPVTFIINCFLFAWFIAGNYWVYHVFTDKQFDDPLLDTFCNRTLYLFAFWIITVAWILLGLTLLCICGLGLIMVLADRK